MEENRIDPKALFTFSYGLYIVGTVWQEKLNAQIADAVMQLTSDPIHIAVCLHRDNLTTELVTKSRKFTVSVLAQEASLPFIGTFGFRTGRDFDKFVKCAYTLTESGLPIVTESTLAAVEADVVEIVEVHTHKLFIGKVKSARALAEGTPLTYADYHKIKKGKSPENAPSAVFNALKP
ncbi:MAG: flavin reductase family protein [Synergistaceae bacterium]|jgi:flavin reductase (DIM6/NTAB) family NADH-FMN oxidoreductase RutF|nr:flavin reductase family protein [Synergistaceae bacterium]